MLLDVTIAKATEQGTKKTPIYKWIYLSSFTAKSTDNAKSAQRAELAPATFKLLIGCGSVCNS